MQRVLDMLESQLASLRYGTLEITVHDGRVVQIERKEKIRVALDRRARTANSQNTIPTGPPEVS